MQKNRPSEAAVQQKQWGVQAGFIEVSHRAERATANRGVAQYD